MEAETKWPTFSRRHVQLDFLEWKYLHCQIKFHWNMFLGVSLAICQHWFRQWLGAVQAPSHYPNQCRPSAPTHIGGTKGRWVNYQRSHPKITHIINNLYGTTRNTRIDAITWKISRLILARVARLILAKVIACRLTSPIHYHVTANSAFQWCNIAYGMQRRKHDIA